MSEAGNNKKLKGFVQVERRSTGVAVSTSESDLANLDPLSMFVMEGTSVKAEDPIPISTSTSAAGGKITASGSQASLSRGGSNSQHQAADLIDAAVKRPSSLQSLSAFSTHSNPTAAASFSAPNSARASVSPSDSVIENTLKRPSLVQVTEKAFDEDVLDLFTGEQKVMSLQDTYLLVPTGYFIPVILFMTNYRLAFIPTANDLAALSNLNMSIHSWLQLPLAAVDKIERERRTKDSHSNSVNLIISCKDFRQYRITIKSNNHTGEYDVERAIGVLTTYAFPNNMKYLFAFHHKLSGLPPNYSCSPHDAVVEYSRMGLLDHPLWRVTTANKEYKLCSSYPAVLITPTAVSDEELFVVASFRSGRRLPVLCWADSNNGATMWRSSQPKSGVSGVSCAADEKMLDVISRSMHLISGSSSSSHQHNHRHSNTHQHQQQLHQRKHNPDPLLHIVDCRSRTSAMANRAAGAGYESQANYPNCRLEFYGIPNIHAVRESYKGLGNILLNPAGNAAGDVTFSKQVEETLWLTNVRTILKGAHDVALSIKQATPVLVHCSHGWDRTAQVCALAQLLLDPYYRTIDGFKMLVEKEWCAFGHPFQMRCAHSQDKVSRQEEQMSPIMIQFLDCVWQLQQQFTEYFEFNARYILCIADHVYSGRFGNFLFSSELDRTSFGSRPSCADIWTYLEQNKDILRNDLYREDHLRYIHPTAGLDMVLGAHHNAATSAAAGAGVGAGAGSRNTSVDNGLSTRAYHILLPPLTQLLRNVTLWSDFFQRWSSVPSQVQVPPTLRKYLYSSNGACVPAPPTSPHTTAAADGTWNSDAIMNDGCCEQTVGTLSSATAAAADSADHPNAKYLQNRHGPDYEIKAAVSCTDLWEAELRKEKAAQRTYSESCSENAMLKKKIVRLHELITTFLPTISDDSVQSALSAALQDIVPEAETATTVSAIAAASAIEPANTSEELEDAVVAEETEDDEHAAAAAELLSNGSGSDRFDETEDTDSPTNGHASQQQRLSTDCRGGNLIVGFPSSDDNCEAPEIGSGPATPMNMSTKHPVKSSTAASLAAAAGALAEDVSGKVTRALARNLLLSTSKTESSLFTASDEDGEEGVKEEFYV